MRLACVIQARPDQVDQMCGPGGSSFCIADPEKKSHRAIGLRRMSLWKILTARGLWSRRKQAQAKGHRQDWRRTFARESDGLLVPGAALIGPGGKILWLYRGEHTGDLPPADALLAVAQEHWDPHSSQHRTR